MRWHHTLALSTWAEALRDPVLHKRARALYLETLDHIGELAGRWRDEAYIPPNAGYQCRCRDAVFRSGTV